MKKLLSICALAAFLGASIVGCGGSPSTPEVKTPPAGKDTPKKPDDMKKDK